MVNEQDYVELGLNCADICGALDRGLNGKRLDDISQSVCEAIRQLTMQVVMVSQFLRLTDNTLDHTRAASDIRKKATRLSGRGHVSRLLYAKGDKEKIAAWKLELNRILLVFNVRPGAITSLLLMIPFSDRIGDQYLCDDFQDQCDSFQHPCNNF